MSRLVIVLGVAWLFTLGFAGPAGAQFTPTELDQITEHLRRGSSYLNGNTPMPCGTACQALLQAERRDVANQAKEIQLSTEYATLRQRTGMLPSIKNVGTLRLVRPVPAVGPFVFVSVLSFGYDVNRRYLKLGYKVPEAGNAAEQFSDPRLVWSEDPRIADHNPPSGGGDLILPANTWHFLFRWGNGDAWRWLEYGGEGQCNYEDFPIFEGLKILSRARPQSCFITWDPFPNAVFADGTAKAAYTANPQVVEPLQDWPPPDGEWQHTVPGTGQTQESFEEDRAQTEQELLEHPDDFELVIPDYLHDFHPEEYPDPTTTEQHDHRCDLGEPTYKNPGGNVSPGKLTIRDPIPYETTGRPSEAPPSAPDPYLRWGSTTWGGDHLDNWPGWGWRHIHAKHGWTEGPGLTDESATRSTLAAPVASIENDDHTSMTYVGPEVERNGVLCTRVVVVQYEPKEDDPVPYGIITSYERFDGEAG